MIDDPTVAQMIAYFDLAKTYPNYIISTGRRQGMSMTGARVHALWLDEMTGYYSYRPEEEVTQERIRSMVDRLVSDPLWHIDNVMLPIEPEEPEPYHRPVHPWLHVDKTEAVDKDTMYLISDAIWEAIREGRIRIPLPGDHIHLTHGGHDG